MVPWLTAARKQNRLSFPEAILSGGNPQIPKGDGIGPVKDSIAAMPGWKAPVGERIHEILLNVVPDARLAVRWNQPFDPMPPKESRHEELRYLDIREDDEVDEAQLGSWLEQSARLPGASL